MIDWLISVYGKCRDLTAKATDAKGHLQAGDDDTAKMINGYMKHDYDAYSTPWRTGFHADGGQCSIVMADAVPR